MLKNKSKKQAKEGHQSPKEKSKTLSDAFDPLSPQALEHMAEIPSIGKRIQSKMKSILEAYYKSDVVISDDKVMAIFTWAPHWTTSKGDEINKHIQWIDLYIKLRQQIVYTGNTKTHCLSQKMTDTIMNTNSIITVQVYVNHAESTDRYHTTKGDGLCALRSLYQSEKGSKDPDIAKSSVRDSFIEYITSLQQRLSREATEPLNHINQVQRFLKNEYHPQSCNYYEDNTNWLDVAEVLFNLKAIERPITLWEQGDQATHSFQIQLKDSVDASKIPQWAKNVVNKITQNKGKIKHLRAHVRETEGSIIHLEQGTISFQQALNILSDNLVSAHIGQSGNHFYTLSVLEQHERLSLKLLHKLYELFSCIVDEFRHDSNEEPILGDINRLKNIMKTYKKIQKIERLNDRKSSAFNINKSEVFTEEISLEEHKPQQRKQVDIDSILNSLQSTSQQHQGSVCDDIKVDTTNFLTTSEPSQVLQPTGTVNTNMQEMDNNRVSDRNPPKQIIVMYTDGSCIDPSDEKLGKQIRQGRHVTITDHLKAAMNGTAKELSSAWAIVMTRKVYDSKDPILKVKDAVTIQQDDIRHSLNTEYQFWKEIHGVVFLKSKPQQSKNCSPNYYIGATKHSNQAAEISAIFYALAKAIEIVYDDIQRGSDICLKHKYHFVFVSDSLTTLYMVLGGDCPKQSNIHNMVDWCRKALCCLRELVGKERVQMVHVNSHTKTPFIFNQQADQIAKQAARDRFSNCLRYNTINISENIAKTKVTQRMLSTDQLLLQKINQTEERMEMAEVTISQIDPITTPHTIDHEDVQEKVERVNSQQRKVIVENNNKYNASGREVTVGDPPLEKKEIQQLNEVLQKRRHKKDITIQRRDGTVVIYKAKQKLCDIPYADINGILLQVQRTDNRIDYQYVNAVCTIYCKIITSLKNRYDKRRSTNDRSWNDVTILEHCKRLHFLPNLLIRRVNVRKKGDVELHHAKMKLIGDESGWKMLTLGDLPLRSKPSLQVAKEDLTTHIASHKEGSLTDKMIKRIMHCVQSGEPSAGYRMLTNDTGLAPRNEQTMEALRNCFPELVQPISERQKFTKDEYKTKFKITQDDLIPEPVKDSHVVYEPVVLEKEMIMQYINNCDKTKSPGFDGLRPRHILQMISGSGKNPIRKQFLELFCWLLNQMINGEIPPEYARLMAEAEVVPADKGNNKVRPIQMVQTFRKIVGSLLAATIDIEIFGNIQFGIKRRFGVEHIAHAIQMQIDNHPKRDKVFVDFENAFNNISREQVLKMVALKFPHLFPFFNLMYAQCINTWVYTEKDQGVAIPADEGMIQGDPLGSFGFALGGHPLFEECNMIAGGIQNEMKVTQNTENTLSHVMEITGMCAAYVDDFSSSTDSQKSLQLLNTLLEKGPAIGLKINKRKTKILLGKKGSWIEAQKAREQYIALGFDMNNIFIHPDDKEHPKPITTKNAKVFLVVEKDLQLSKAYGHQCLGVPVGTDDYIVEWLHKKLQDLEVERDGLLRLPTFKQGALLMLRYSFCNKVNYLLRCLPSKILTQTLSGNKSFLELFDDMKIQVLESIMEIPINSLNKEQKVQAMLMIRDGGLGLQDSSIIANAAYTASVRSCLDYLSMLEPTILEELQHSWLQTVSQENEYQPKTINAEWIQKMKENNKSHIQTCENLIAAIEDIVHQNKKFDIIELFIKEQTDKEFTKLQNRLQKPIRDSFQQSYIENLNEMGKIRLNSCIGNKEDASAWLETIPYNNSISMSDNSMKSALKFRLGIEFPELKGFHGTMCPREKCGQKLDEYGHHIVSGCKSGSQRHNHHESVVKVIQDLLKNPARRVEKGQAIKSTLANRERIIPDIDVYHLGKKDMLDITIVDRLLPYYNINNTTKPSDRSKAEDREKAKLDKYAQNGVISSTINGSVIPIAIETLGKIGPIGYKYLCNAAASYEKGYKRATIKKYWFSKISVALHNSIGNSIEHHLQQIVNTSQAENERNFIEQEEMDNEVYQAYESGIKRTSCERGITHSSQ
jgi:ribonuclease HI